MASLWSGSPDGRQWAVKLCAFCSPHLTSGEDPAPINPFFPPLPFGLAWRAVFGSYQQLMSHSAIFVIQTQSWSITLFQMKGELTKKDCQCDVWECLPVPSGTEENLDTSIQRRGIREHVSFLIKNDQSQFMEKKPDLEYGIWSDLKLVTYDQNTRFLLVHSPNIVNLMEHFAQEMALWSKRWHFYCSREVSIKWVSWSPSGTA